MSDDVKTLLARVREFGTDGLCDLADAIELVAAQAARTEALAVATAKVSFPNEFSIPESVRAALTAVKKARGASSEGRGAEGQRPAERERVIVERGDTSSPAPVPTPPSREEFKRLVTDCALAWAAGEGDREYDAVLAAYDALVAENAETHGLLADALLDVDEARRRAERYRAKFADASNIAHAKLETFSWEQPQGVACEAGTTGDGVMAARRSVAPEVGGSSPLPLTPAPVPVESLSAVCERMSLVDRGERFTPQDEADIRRLVAVARAAEDVVRMVMQHRVDDGCAMCCLRAAVRGEASHA